ncbi:hypothetical protein X474_06855 [Dethiosulfatarculus sandiegensis]|uniref:Uncharacterized protein n=1 Tax=Dethiosulfatarculus sandiegensis TaxID=1429043 RepID=A0A0D2J9N6_9BACT|nr:hypothetical protein X474_06855 [Dethiosulfatarculus sandiegensis]
MQANLGKKAGRILIKPRRIALLLPCLTHFRG